MKKSDIHKARVRLRVKNRFLTLSIFCAMLLGLVFCKTTQGPIQPEDAVVGIETTNVLPVAIQNVVIADPASSTSSATVLAASVGGNPGVFISRQMDLEAQAIKKSNIKGAQVTRIGEGIKVTFDGMILFPKNSDSVSVDSRENLKHVADILNEYGDTNIIIEGHTDGTGEEPENLTLSAKRANSVAEVLKENRVSTDRIKTVGYGESQPLFSNETEEGKAKNRRVELLIIANDQLKLKAKTKRSSTQH